jgi:hypothetical protein
LRELLMLIDAQDRSIQHLEVEIERHLHPSARAGETLRKDQWSQPTRLAGVDGGGRNRSLPLSRCRAS